MRNVSNGVRPAAARALADRRIAPLAAIGLAAIMIGAAISHASLHEPRNVALNFVMFAMSLAIALGRF